MSHLFIFQDGPLAILAPRFLKGPAENLEPLWKSIGESKDSRRRANGARPLPPIRFQGRVLHRLLFQPRTPPRLHPQFPRRHLGGQKGPWTDDVGPQSPCGAVPTKSGRPRDLPSSTTDFRSCGKTRFWCHSERSEESLFDLGPMHREILRFAQNDKRTFSAACEAVPYEDSRNAG